jgi:hypothetical protein
MPLGYVVTRRTTRSRPGPALRRVSRGAPILLLGILLTLPGPVHAADAISRLVKGPLIRLDQRSVDFGRIPQHTRVTHTFTISNDGTELLRLIKVKPDCGCTLAEPADTLLAPGTSTTLRVVFNSGNYEGEQRKVVVMETNDPAEPRLDLLLLSYVTQDVEISDRILAFGPVRRGQTPVLATTLTAEPGVPFTVRSPLDARELVEWSVARDPQTGPEAWKLEARIRPDAPLGRFDVKVEIPLDHPKKKAGHISVRGLIHSYFSPADLGINFSSLTAGRTLTRTLRLNADGPGDYRITAARVSVPWLTTSLQRDGNDYVLSVTLDAKEPRRVKETVVLETTDPQQPELPIEVRGTVR